MDDNERIVNWSIPEGEMRIQTWMLLTSSSPWLIEDPWESFSTSSDAVHQAGLDDRLFASLQGVYMHIEDN